MLNPLSDLFSQFKFYFIAAGAILLAFLLWQSHNFMYRAGKDSVKLEYETANAAQLEKNQVEIAEAVEAAKLDAKKQRDHVVAELDSMRALNQKLEAINNEIIHANFTCPDVGSEFLRLFNAPIRAANCRDQQCGDPGDVPRAHPAASIAEARAPR